MGGIAFIKANIMAQQTIIKNEYFNENNCWAMSMLLTQQNSIGKEKTSPESSVQYWSDMIMAMKSSVCKLDNQYKANMITPQTQAPTH